MVELEQRGQPYLLRLRQTKNVQRLVARQFARDDWSRPDMQGCQAVEDWLKLEGWSRARRVVIVRRRVRDGLVREERNETGQLRLALADAAVLNEGRLWEYTVLVTDITYPIEAVAQLYRDRCDCENGFDELKNQWGLSGFTTQDLSRCQTTARTGALVYNWWSWYCCAAHPGARLEAVTSRPLLLAAVGKATHHAGQTHRYLTPLHAKTDMIKSLVVNIRAALQHVRRCAEQLPNSRPWAALARYICQRIPPSLHPLLISSPPADTGELPDLGLVGFPMNRAIFSCYKRLINKRHPPTSLAVLVSNGAYCGKGPAQQNSGNGFTCIDG